MYTPDEFGPGSKSAKKKGNDGPSTIIMHLFSIKYYN